MSQTLRKAEIPLSVKMYGNLSYSISPVTSLTAMAYGARDDLPERGRMPSLNDVPHQLGAALSYKFNAHSFLSVGGMMRSGKVIEFGDDLDITPDLQFRTGREPLVYRVDVGYSFEKAFGHKLLALRCGLYNVVGRPSDEDVLSFYSATWHGNCLPYASISFKF